MTLKLRDMTSDERAAIKRLAHSRTAPAREVERAPMVEMARPHSVTEHATKLLRDK